MKKSFYSTLCMIAVCSATPTGVLAAGDGLVSSAILLLGQSPPGAVLFDGEWHSGHELARKLSAPAMKLAACGGAVGGTGPADDYDGDGVCNDIDLDDDNDGILDNDEQTSCVTSEVLEDYNGFWTNKSALSYKQYSESAGTRIAGYIDSGTEYYTFTLGGLNPNVANTLKFRRYSLNPQNGKSITVRLLIDGVQRYSYTTTSGQTNPPSLTIDHGYTTVTFTPTSETSTVRIEFIAAVNSTVGSDGLLTEFNVNGAMATICMPIDTDNDGIADYLDLDSDGDGCPDATEGGAGFTASSLMNSSIDGGNTAGAATFNGYAGPVVQNLGNTVGADGVPTVASTGQAVGASRLMSPDSDGDGIGDTCDPTDERPDSDGDGVKDFADIDDDNDGIADAEESPACFYTAAEAGAVSKVYTALLNDDGTNVELPFMHDGVTTSVAASNNVITANQAVNDAVVYNLEFPTQVRLASITHNGTTFGTSATAMIQGSNDRTTWVDLMTAATAATAATKTFTVNNNAANSYQYYRIKKIAGTSTPAITTYEVGAIQNTVGFVASRHPKASCGADADSDGIPNHLDLDSDGDGCSDLSEAGVTPVTDVITPASTNAAGGSYGIANTAESQLDPAAADNNGDGLNDSVDIDQNSIPDYASTYASYALASGVNACTDTDGDGLGDIADIDDDNDGILDAVESPGCYYTATEANTIARITSQFTSPDDDQADGDIQLLHDGATTLTFNFNAFIVANNPAGSNLLTVEYPVAVRLATLVVSDNISATANANAVVVGSNDGVNWSAALSPATVITTTPVIFTLTTGQGYKYYRVETGSVPGALATGNTIGEVTSTLSSGYVPSAHPKATCTADADADGIVNQYDLDSDGDGCPDATEGAGGFTTADLVESELAGGNSGTGYTGAVTFGVDDNLGNDVDVNGVPVIANGGQAIGQSQVAGTPCPENEPCELEMGGTVYRDTDGIGNGINGKPIDGSKISLYMTLVNADTIQSVADVGSNGTYRFTGLAPGTYQIVLTTNASGSLTSMLPSGAVYVGEGGAIDPGSGNPAGDGTPDGTTSVTLSCPGAASDTLVHFGLDHPMPVTLISFAAGLVSEGTLLEWRTADEKDFDRFEIEQSVQPKVGFSKIGVVKGAGSSYTFIDPSNRIGTSYYRLKMVDTDGSFTYSKVVTITKRNGLELHRIFPNPSNGHVVRIVTLTAIDSYKAFDASGREVGVEMHGEAGEYRFIFNKAVQPGVYVIIYTTAGKSVSQQFVLSY